MVDALLSADIALAPLVEDWVENYQQTANDDVSEKASVHELILFVIRACGLAAEVDEDEAMDVDGVLDVVERIQDESVRVSHQLGIVSVDLRADGSGYDCCLPFDLEGKNFEAVQDQPRSFYLPLDQNDGHLRHPFRRSGDHIPHYFTYLYSPHLAQYHVVLSPPSDSTYFHLHGVESRH